MSQKKLLNKRRVRNFIPRLLFLCVIFILTSSGLFAWYFISKAGTRKFVSPLVTQNQAVKKQIIVNPDESTQLSDILKKNNLNTISVVTASDSALLVTLDNGEEIIFSQKKNITEQITSLQLIKRELTIEGKRLSRVDFRFDNPVISY